MDTPAKQRPAAWVHPDTGEIPEFTVANTSREIKRMVKGIRKHAAGEIHVCYEAGTCGFVLQWLLEKHRSVLLTTVCPRILGSDSDRVMTVGFHTGTQDD